MPQNSRPENESDQNFDPIGSFLSEWSDPEDEEEEFRNDFFQGFEGRRKKAALAMMIISLVTMTLHYVTWGAYAVYSLTILLAIQLLRLIAAKPALGEAATEKELTTTPSISLLVAAKNEEAVIAKLVKSLFELDYPQDQYEVWIIDDYSTDKTPEILDQLALTYQQLKVLHRPANAGGGKSGALNQVLPLTKGEIVGVFDADAGVPKNLLWQIASLFQTEKIGAIQVRKAIANETENFWTEGQGAEMALDSYFQQKRIAIGGLGELRGNGQFVRRRALDSCGGWNEQTITDDLDLTFRLHLDQWDIGFLQTPPVEEEGVTTTLSLWHQRNRWAEGGYQRYLDYWRWLISDHLSWQKKADLLCFLTLQYLIPTAAIPDLLISLIRHRLPIFSPFTAVVLSFSYWGMFRGLASTYPGEKIGFTEVAILLWRSFTGMLYMFHWFVILPSTTLRMAIRRKRLKWVKTVHQGSNSEMSFN